MAKMAELRRLIQMMILVLTTCCLVFLRSSSTPALPPSTLCIPRERDALLTFKASLTDPENSLVPWQGEDCCRWRGVRCSNRTGHVVEFQLDDLGLLRVRGEMSSSLLDLHHLRGLYLTGNMFNCAPIPKFFGSLKSLRYLEVVANFGGPIPPHLGNLSNLLELRLVTIDNLSVSSYSSDLAWLKNLQKLRSLELSYVNLNKAIYWAHAVNMLPYLLSLDLYNCRLQSIIAPPLHSNLTLLQHVDLSGNSFNSPFGDKYFIWVFLGLPRVQTLSLEYCELQDPLHEVVGNLTSVKELSLHGNNLSMGVLTTLKSSHKLEWLDFAENNISGQLPELVAGNMTKLRYIDFSDNHITSIPTTFNSLHKLEMLVLSKNNINMDISEILERLPRDSLQLLFLDYNSLTGSLPVQLEHLRNLTAIYLTDNNLRGEIPLGIGALTKLKRLSLGGNNLDGIITELHFEKLQNLTDLHLFDNSLKIVIDKRWVPPFKLYRANLRSCKLGPEFPEWLKSQDSIFELNMSNTSIADIIPHWFWTTFSKAHYLSFAKNQISGTLPAALLEIMSLEFMDFSANHFKGRIPTLPMNLAFLDLSGNCLSGPLPSHFGTPMLETLILYNNSLCGNIPFSFCQLQNLQFVDLSENKLEATFPNCKGGSESVKSATSNHHSSADPMFHNSTPANIIMLKLNGNKLSGPFPLFLQSCQHLSFLDLSYNEFSGVIPTWIGVKLPSLAFLKLRSNMFSGHVPHQLSKMKLQYLDLSCNNISGTIPQSLVNLISMTLIERDSPYDKFFTGFTGHHPFDVLDYADGSLVVTKGQQLKFTTGIRYMVNIDLSFNSLRGPIPKEIGKLVALKAVNLSWNHLSGAIPESISGLQALESLDLSNNELSGEIPASLSALTSLSLLNLSYNNLSGRIPSGYQLRALDNQSSIYMGNPGLCGPPLSKSCPDTKFTLDNPQEREHTSHEFFFYLGVGIAFMMGLWTVLCAFLFWRKWRVAWFSFSDRLYDWVYVQVAVSWTSLTKKFGGS